MEGIKCGSTGKQRARQGWQVLFKCVYTCNALIKLDLHCSNNWNISVYIFHWLYLSEFNSKWLIDSLHHARVRKINALHLFKQVQNTYIICLFSTLNAFMYVFSGACWWWALAAVIHFKSLEAFCCSLTEQNTCLRTWTTSHSTLQTCICMFNPQRTTLTKSPFLLFTFNPGLKFLTFQMVLIHDADHNIPQSHTYCIYSCMHTGSLLGNVSVGSQRFI